MPAVRATTPGRAIAPLVLGDQDCQLPCFGCLALKRNRDQRNLARKHGISQMGWRAEVGRSVPL